MFGPVKWLNLQQPLIMVIAMVTGRNVNDILALNLHDRLLLVAKVLQEMLELVLAAAKATDPAGPGGVTLTEEEFALIVDEADDPKIAVQVFLDTFKETAEEAEAEGTAGD